MSDADTGMLCGRIWLYESWEEVSRCWVSSMAGHLMKMALLGVCMIGINGSI
jgi:hypothetical protein